MYKLHYTWYI